MDCNKIMENSTEADGFGDQGSRKSKIGWEPNKSGCHVRSPELLKKKKKIICSFQTNASS